MGTLHEDLKARFAWVRQDLEKILSKLHDADLPWRPTEGMRTVANELLEIANKEKEAMVWMQTGEWPDGGPDAFDEQRATLQEIRFTLASLRGATYAYIDSLSEDQLNERIPNPNRWWEGMRLDSCPRSEVIRNIAAHEWYHTGQLVVYLWMQGRESGDE